jgi:glycosyltransferase involved in cell wall biosynthesis
MSKPIINEKRSIGFPHRSPEIGGPGSFQERLSSVLKEKGWSIIYPDSRIVPDIILVVGGTAKLHWLWKCRLRGTKIVHRIDGINWLHRVLPMPMVVRVKQEIRNWLICFTRNTFADHVVYQSVFVRNWWSERFGQVRCEESLIYNGVDLSVFCPREQKHGKEKPQLLCVEGNFLPDPVTMNLLKYLAKRLYEDNVISRTIVYAHIPNEEIRYQLSNIKNLALQGNIPRQMIHEVYNNAVYLSLDINAACPNSVIEALASGIPVIGFDTGALRELVTPEAGILVRYNTNPRKLEAPDVLPLERAAHQVFEQWDKFSKGARAVAEERFGLDKMVDSYLAVFEKIISNREVSK